MLLPQEIQQKIEGIISNQKLKNLKQTQKLLMEKYKTKSGNGESLINSREDGILYSLSRMPATYSVILTLLMQLREQGILENISSTFDVGSGTGAGFFALKAFDDNINVELFERDKFMIETFLKLEENKKVEKFDLIKDNFEKKANLVLSSYVLSELDLEQTP